jgi:hypothetical protein
MKFGEFPHDANARTDDKIIKLLSEEGARGYGLYFMILEDLYNAKGNIIPLNYIKLQARSFGTSEKMLKNVIYNFDLFAISENGYYSSKRMIEYKQKEKLVSDLQKEKVLKRWDTAGNTDGNTGVDLYVRTLRTESKDVSKDVRYDDFFINLFLGKDLSEIDKVSIKDSFYNYIVGKEVKYPAKLISKFIDDYISQKTTKPTNNIPKPTNNVPKPTNNVVPKPTNNNVPKPTNNITQPTSNIDRVKGIIGQMYIDKAKEFKYFLNDNDVENLITLTHEEMEGKAITNVVAYAKTLITGILSKYQEKNAIKKLLEESRLRQEEEKKVIVGDNLIGLNAYNNSVDHLAKSKRLVYD